MVEPIYQLHVEPVAGGTELGVLIVRDGAERFQVLPGRGRSEDDILDEELPPLLARVLGPGSGQMIRANGETVLALSRLDLGYRLRPTTGTELDWMRSLFADWIRSPGSRAMPVDMPGRPEPAGRTEVPEQPEMPNSSEPSARTGEVLAAPAEAGVQPPVSPSCPLPAREAGESDSLRALARDIAAVRSVVTGLPGSVEALHFDLRALDRRLQSFEQRETEPLALPFMDLAEPPFRDPAGGGRVALRLVAGVLMLACLVVVAFMAGFAAGKPSLVSGAPRVWQGPEPGPAPETPADLRRVAPEN
ncbi:hypothetical protein LAZ40_11890 [Cereibacter sphaeroides]|uniref:hypothetical protein n=1 Tax=Cereibacter sphaeroides TaxID=1063 RepID=UPI001F1A52B8|nr:hypothetical protein [Cereibacter sphaeroides]MCE6959721.1 hypothetical protein [Cereibacter sphaeroides]MCE6974418.1 hypothetical protein [Cereibacter sphaeroides]